MLTNPSPAIRHHPRPAGLGVMCDAWQPTGNPDGPYLRRCHRRATIRLTLRTTSDCYDVKRCPDCAGKLRRKLERGATFEILAEEEIK